MTKKQRFAMSMDRSQLWRDWQLSHRNFECTTLQALGSGKCGARSALSLRRDSQQNMVGHVQAVFFPRSGGFNKSECQAFDGITLWVTTISEVEDFASTNGTAQLLFSSSITPPFRPYLRSLCNSRTYTVQQAHNDFRYLRRFPPRWHSPGLSCLPLRQESHAPLHG